MVEIRRRPLKPFQLTVTGLASAMAAPGGGGTSGLPTGGGGGGGGGGIGDPSPLVPPVYPPQVATPTFSPNGGVVLITDPITIACATSGATIYYTTDGSTPTRASAVYTGAITVSSYSPVYIKALGVAPGRLDSDVATAAFSNYTGRAVRIDITAAQNCEPCGVGDWANGSWWCWEGNSWRAQNVALSGGKVGGVRVYPDFGTPGSWLLDVDYDNPGGCNLSWAKFFDSVVVGTSLGPATRNYNSFCTVSGSLYYGNISIGAWFIP